MSFLSNARTASSAPSDISTKAKPRRAARFPIRNDVDRLDRAEFAEKFSDFVFGRAERQVSYIEFLAHIE